MEQSRALITLILAVLFGVAIGYRWCWRNHKARLLEMMDGMRMQERIHQAEKEQWLRCAIPPIPRQAPDDEFGA